MIYDAHVLQSNSALSRNVHGSDATFLEYEKQNKSRLVGGVSWILQSLFDGHVFREEGI